MHPDTRKQFAVITGDFIGFSHLGVETRQRMPVEMARCGEALMQSFPGVMSHQIAVFRGDAWQALIDDPVRSFRAALFIRAYIRSATAGTGLDTRMAIGIGAIDYVPAGQVSAGDGDAYRRSGKRLEAMARPNKGRLRYACPEDTGEAMTDAVVRLAGTFADAWSSRQAHAILGALQGHPPARIAAEWSDPITRQAVGKHLARAAWPAIAHAVAVFEGWMAKGMK